MTADEYPKDRKGHSYFAYRFIRLLGKVCLANEVGADGFALLTMVAITEDAAGYKRPVTWYNEQLMPLIGIASVSSLIRARTRCVNAGWLRYLPGAKSKAARYWVVIPEQHMGIDDAPTDEYPEKYSANKNATPSRMESTDNSHELQTIIAAMAEVTHNDPATDRRFTRAAQTLHAGGYTADDVRKFGSRYWKHCPEAKDKREYPDIPELVRKIGRTRDDKKREQKRAQTTNVEQSKADAQAAADDRARREQQERDRIEAERRPLREWFEAQTESVRADIEKYILTRFKSADRVLLQRPSTEWSPVLADRYQRERDLVIRARMAESKS